MTTTNDFIPGGTPESFTVASNWTLGHVPTSTEDALIASANGDALINATGATVDGVGTGITDTLRIENDATLTLVNGTDTNANFGSIVVSTESQLAIVGGALDNAGTIELDGFNIPGFTAFIDIEGPGSVIFAGGGNIEMTISGGQTANLITSPGEFSLLNEDNTISGDGTLGDGLRLTNGSAGLIETNNSTSSSGGHMQIEGSAGGGSFVNDGTMRIDPTGEFIFGEDSSSATINNESQIKFDPSLQTATLAIAGNVTIQATFGTTGQIEMGGPGYSGNQIVSDGNPATLTLSNQTLDGAGSVGDANLTLTLLNSTIDADVANEPLIIFTGSNSIANGGTLAAFDGDMVINSPVNNTGTIEVGGATGIVDLFGAVSGSGAITVGGGTLDVHAAISGDIAFTSGDATIAVEAGANLQGVISGAASTDDIDVKSVSFVSGVHAVWQQNGSTGTLSLVNNGSTLAAFTLSGQYTSADFAASSDGNGGTLIQVVNPPPPTGTTADMIMRDNGNGNYEIFDLGSNTIQAAYALGQIGLQWQVAGVGGFDGSDTSDMILREDSGTQAGSFEVYDISNNNIINTAAMGQVGLEWTVAGFGDFSSRSGETDMLMRDSNTGQFEIYDVSNNAITSAAPMGQVGTEWQVAGFGDFSTRAGETDMMMRNSNTGQFEIYDISNNAITSATSIGQVGLEWQVLGFGDFSGSANETDMLMRDVNNGDLEIYDISNNSISGAASMGQVGIEWQVLGFGPINGAGASDMLMRDTNNSALEVFDIAHNHLTAAAAMGQVGSEWSAAGIAADPPGGSALASAQLAQAMASFEPAGSAVASPPAPDQAATQSMAPNVLAPANGQSPLTP